MTLMKKITFLRIGLLAVLSICGTNTLAGDTGKSNELERVVNDTIRPIMEENHVPGIAVAITVDGKRHFFNYGVASKESVQKVTQDTIFEIGSVSKTFTATLGAYAAASGAMSFAENGSKYLPDLAGSRFDKISVLDLGTYTAGGLPLQFPDAITDEKEMIAYYRNWRPTYEPGTHRQYSNPSIGLFGYLAARSLGRPFNDLMEEKIFPALGLSRTYIRVPPDRMGDYAYGYSEDGKPIRVTPGVLDAEAYGVKTTATDMLRFVEVNMDGTKLDATLKQAIAMTHTGFYKIGDLTQGLGWEMYAYPIDLDRLLAGNSSDMAFKANAASKLAPPLAPRDNMLLNKTGSTNGFGAYVAFVPAKHIGIVMLANKNYPNSVRVKAAYRILAELDKELLIGER